MPCFNAEPYLVAALESVLAQSWHPLEIIAVNDGSTDRTGEILDRYQERGVRVIHQENRGQCAAANRALTEAQGELLKFFDADDILAPDMIVLQVARLAGRRDAVAMGEWARFYSDLSEADFRPLPMYRDATPVDWLTDEWSRGEPMMQCAMWLIPVEILERTGGWDERLSLDNDFEFFARVLLAADEILYTPAARLYYRSGILGSLSGQKSRKAVESQFISLTLGTEHLLKAEDSSRTRRACANVLQAFEYAHYPSHPDLITKMRARIAELGGSDLKPSGPPGFQKLRSWTGWRAARRVQLLSERWGLNRASRTKAGRS
jgi:glycosyltransferase involved in cell wall biosynthesis